MINRVVNQPVLTTLTLTFGLDLILYNFMTVYYTATPRRVTLDLGVVDLGGIVIPVDRLLGMALALMLTGILYLVMRRSTHRPRDRRRAHGQRCGRADGHQGQPHLRHHLRHRRADGRRDRRDLRDGLSGHHQSQPAPISARPSWSA